MKNTKLKIATLILILYSLINSVQAQNVYCPCQSITTNLNFNDTHDIECAIMQRVNCLLGAGPKCVKETTISWQNDGLVTYVPSNGTGTVHQFSQNLLNVLQTNVFNGICGNSALPITPSTIQAFANVIYNRIISQAPTYAPNKINRIRNLKIDDVGMCYCNNQGCAYDFHWDYNVSKCAVVETPNKN